MSRRRRSLRFRLAAAALLLAVSAVAAELLARAVGAELPAWRLIDAEGVVMTGHPSRLWGLSPGEKHNGVVRATINALGMRGALPIAPKPADRPRVLVVGDSTWFGHGVEDEQTFGAQLERLLQGAGVDAEVLNGAVPGYSTEQTRAFLEEQGFGLAIDLLVVGSLWSDNNVDSFRDADLLKSARAAAENPLLASHFFRLLAAEIDRMRGGTGARLVTWTKASQFPEKGGRRVPIERYGENLDWMAREAAARDAGVLFVAPCNIGIVARRYPDGASWNVYFAAQKAVAEHHGVPYVATLPAMQEAAADGGAERLFVDVMHPSAEGHAIFAREVADALLAAGWPATRLAASGERFPFEELHDNRFGQGDTNPDSPQRNLFGELRGAGTPVDAPAPGDALRREGLVGEGPHGGGGAGPGASGAGAAEAGGQSTGPGGDGAGGADPRGRWVVRGTVSGEGPFLVEARGTNGVAVASARLGAAGPFSMRVRGDLEQVELVVTGAGGARATRTVAKGAQAGEIALGL